MNTFQIQTDLINRDEHLSKVLAVLNDPASHQRTLSSSESYLKGYNRSLLLHAKIYHQAHVFGIQPLKDLAYKRLQTSFLNYLSYYKSFADALEYMMHASVVEEAIAKALCKELESFGWWKPVVDVLDKYPQLERYCLRYTYEKDM
jgi:hypothetical protein